MATSLGKQGYLRVSALTVIQLRNYTLSHTSDTVEDSVIGADYKSRQSTLRDWSVTGQLFWDPVDAGQAAAVAAILTTTGAVTIDLYPGGVATAATYYSGRAIITDVSVSGSHDGMVERSFSADGGGQLSTLTV